MSRRHYRVKKTLSCQEDIIVLRRHYRVKKTLSCQEDIIVLRPLSVVPVALVLTKSALFYFLIMLSILQFNKVHIFNIYQENFTCNSSLQLTII
jgi:hypothetical protein